jgi:hypothetical protein
VRTTTLTTATTGDKTVLPPTFSRALVGNGGYAGKTVGACSRAAIGKTGSGETKSFTMARCEYNNYLTTHSNTLPPRPSGSTPPKAAYEAVFRLHATSTTSYCAGSPGASSPGGYGMIVPNSGTCHTDLSLATSSSGTWTQGRTSNSTTSGDCDGGFDASISGDMVLLITLYDAVTPSGTDYKYRESDFVAFVVTGYHWGTTGASSSSSITGTNYCTGSAQCVYGYFVSKYKTDGTSKTDGGTDLQESTYATVVQTVA